VSNNLLVVESQNDKYFIEAFSKYLNLSNIEVDTPICNISEFECLGGMSKLQPKLNELKTVLEKNGIAKLGIILDADEEGIVTRVKQINKCIGSICNDVTISSINTLVRSEELDIEIACYITNVGGSGELETVLKTIHSKDATYANCLYAWRKCLDDKNKQIPNKYFDKFWISIYQRYDNCKLNESNAYKNCTGEISMKKENIWNFEHEILKDLRDFLLLFD
jgi:hypothetical protein